MKKLYLLRHGQTEFNVKKLVQGRCDSPLTDLGRQQAGMAAAWLKAHGVVPDKVVSSPLGRAMDTASLVATELLGADAAAEFGRRTFGKLGGEFALAVGGEPGGALERGERPGPVPPRAAGGGPAGPDPLPGRRVAARRDPLRRLRPGDDRVAVRGRQRLPGPARQPRRYDSSGSTVPLLPDLPAAMPADFRVPLHFSDTHKESRAPAKYVPDTGEAFLLPPAGLSY